LDKFIIFFLNAFKDQFYGGFTLSLGLRTKRIDFISGLGSYFQPNKKETTQTGGFRLIKRLIELGCLQQQVYYKFL
jgi:hypothetical protein